MRNDNEETTDRGVTISEALSTYVEAENRYGVHGRGRPERDPKEADLRVYRRKVFGMKLRQLREKAGLSLSEAARICGIASPRKLSQYETTCYPPGEIVLRLAPRYGVSPGFLGDLVLSHSDPALFFAVTGQRGFLQTDEEDPGQAIYATNGKGYSA
jgi:transcriptional regulator with XRE-family HTH domain